MNTVLWYDFSDLAWHDLVVLLQVVTQCWHAEVFIELAGALRYLPTMQLKFCPRDVPTVIQLYGREMHTWCPNHELKKIHLKLVLGVWEVRSDIFLKVNTHNKHIHFQLYKVASFSPKNRINFWPQLMDKKTGMVQKKRTTIPPYLAFHPYNHFMPEKRTV